MDTLWQDLRYAVRMLVKSPAFTLVAVISLAIGTGANATVFSLVNALLLRPPHGVADASRLTDVYATAPDGESFFQFSYPDYVYYRDHNEVFDGLLAFNFMPLSLNAGDGEPERAFGMIASGNYFSVLGARPTLGRFFLPEEDRTPGTHRVAVISHALWQRRFGGDAGVVGRTVALNGHAFTIIGVAAEKFRGTYAHIGADVWVPVMAYSQVLPGGGEQLGRDGFRFQLRGRLRDGVSIEGAQAGMSVLGRGLAQTYPETNEGVGVNVRPASTLPGEVRPMVAGFMWLLMGIVALVLLIAGANVAGLLLARASARRKEMAIRLATGASRGRIVRQLLTESVLLFMLGGAAGAALAVWTSDLLLAFRPPETILSLDLSLDYRVLGFTLTVSLLAGVAFGLAPALQASKPDVWGALKDETAGTMFGRRRRLNTRSLFVSGQIAVSLVLLIAAGLFVRSLQNAHAIHPGFNADGVQTFSFDLSIGGYDERRGREFYRQIVERTRALPGVASVALAREVPLSGRWREARVNVEGHEPPANIDAFYIDANTIAGNYFQTLEIPVLRGRAFDDRTDTSASPRVVIINETMAARFWPGEDAVGKRFRLTLPRVTTSGDTPFVEVIGVVRNGKYQTPGEEPRPFVYLPFQQAYVPDMILHVRSSGDASLVTAAVRREVRNLDANLPLLNVTPMIDRIGFSLIPLRMATWLVGILGALGLVLAAIGLYGVIAYSVAGRTREIGIRIALGAQRRDVLRIVLRQGLALTIIGVVVGLAGALALTRFLSSLLYGVSATDPVIFIAVALLLAAVAMLACYIPARRATKVDPMVALRYE